MRTIFTLVLVGAVLAGCASSADIPPGATPTELAKLGKSYEEQGNLEAAREVYETIFEDHPTSKEAREAEWLAAEMSYQLDDMGAAKTAYELFNETHPIDHLSELADRVYDVGVRQYEDGASGLLGLGILTTSEEGIETLTWLTENLPSSTKADDAFFYMGRVRLESYMYEEAVLFLDELIERYPQSEWRYEARFLKGEAHFRLNRGPAYDLESLNLALRTFEEYLKEVQRSEERATEYADRIAEAKARIGEVRQRLAEKNVLIADFYDSVERPAAEKIYLGDAVRNFGDTEAGREAGKRLEELSAEEAPEAEGGTPAEGGS